MPDVEPEAAAAAAQPAAPPAPVPAASRPRPKDDGETLEAFVLVMGMSFGPVFGAAAAWLAISLDIIKLPVTLKDGNAMEFMRAGRPWFAGFALVGFLLPILWAAPRLLRRKPS